MSSDTTLIAVSRQIEQECQQVNLNLGRMWRIFTNVLLSDSKLPILTRRSKKEPYHACKLWLRSVHFCGKVLCATLMLNGFSKALLPIIACLWTRQRNVGEKDKKAVDRFELDSIIFSILSRASSVVQLGTQASQEPSCLLWIAHFDLADKESYWKLVCFQ